MLSSTTYALKEWAIAVKALEAGQTILLLRKGGIQEVGGKFQVKYRHVVLYPTDEHQQPHLLKPSYADILPVAAKRDSNTVAIASWAEITHIFSLSNSSATTPLLPYHVWNEHFVHERFKWKPHQPLYLLLLRTYRLPQPTAISYRSEYGGCKSWIELAEPITLAQSLPVLNELEYANRVAAIQKTVSEASLT